MTTEKVKIALLCATHRGYLALKKLAEIEPNAQLIVLSFKEEPWEPPFFNDIRDLAENCHAQFLEAKQVGSPRFASFWDSLSIDLMMTVNWRYMIPPSIYRRARSGTFVFHDSLLPAYRGFSPTVWAMINGEDHTGVTLFEIAEEVDTGPIVDQAFISIRSEDTILEVTERVTDAYLNLLGKNLPALLSGSAGRTPQDHSKATFTCKRLPEDNLITWSAPSGIIYNLIRAVTFPYPGAFTYLNGRLLRVWAAQKLDYPRYVGAIPGRVVQVIPEQGSVVLTGDGALLIKRVQYDGEDAVIASNILNSPLYTLGHS
jgi:methionyl-tRNA formyltransferase